MAQNIRVSGHLDGAQKVEPAVALLPVFAGRILVVGGDLKDLGELIGAQVGPQRQHQRRRTSHMRAGRRGAVGRAVGIPGLIGPERTPDPYARGGDVHVVAGSREAGHTVVGTGRADGQHAGVGGRVVGLVSILLPVAGGRDDQHVMVMGVGDSVAHHVGVVGAAEAHADDSRTLIDRPADARRDVGVVALAAVVEYLDRQNLTAPADAGDAGAVVAVGRRDAGGVGAMPLIVAGVVVVVSEIMTVQELALQVGVRGRDARV